MSRDEIFRYIDKVWATVKRSRPRLSYTIRVVNQPDVNHGGWVNIPLDVKDSDVLLIVNMTINQPLATRYVIGHEFGHVVDFYNKWVRVRGCLSLFRQWALGVHKILPNPQLERMADVHANKTYYERIGR